MIKSILATTLIVMIFIPTSCFGGIPYKLSDFVKMNLGLHTSDSEGQFISMLQAYNRAYDVRYSIRQLYNTILRDDELFHLNGTLVTRVIARTTGISTRFGWYDPKDPEKTRHSPSFKMDGDYFDFINDGPHSFNPGLRPFGFYLDATKNSSPNYVGGLWYSQSSLNSDTGHFDHLIVLRAPDEWLISNTIATSYLLCWEDMFWRGGTYSNNFEDGYAPNSYIPELGTFQSDRDYNDLFIQIDQIVPVPESATLTFLILGSIIILTINYYLKKKDRAAN